MKESVHLVAPAHAKHVAMHNISNGRLASLADCALIGSRQQISLVDTTRLCSTCTFRPAAELSTDSEGPGRHGGTDGFAVLCWGALAAQQAYC